LIEKIQAAFRAAEDGRYIDSAGVPRLNVSRALQELRLVRPGLTKMTLYTWRSQGCVHLGGRVIDTKAFCLRADGNHDVWHKESDILDIKKSLRTRAQGRYGDPSDPQLTPGAIKEEFGIDHSDTRKWEQNGLLEPVHVKPVCGGVPGVLRTYPKSAIQDILAGRSARHAGVYEEAEGNRLNIRLAAKALGVDQRYLRKLIENKQPQVVELLRPEMRTKPFSKWEELTVLESGVPKLKSARAAAKRRKPPRGRWATGRGVLDTHGITHFGQRIRAYGILLRLRQANPGLAHQFPNDRKDQCQLVWQYNLDRLDQILAGRTLFALEEDVFHADNCVASEESPAVEEADALSDLQQGILDALYDYQAFSSGKRVSTDEMAGRKVDAHNDSIRRALHGLKERGLIETQQGRGGGCWLTTKGRQFVEQARR
jgi:hypothetical protein